MNAAIKDGKESKDAADLRMWKTVIKRISTDATKTFISTLCSRAVEVEHPHMRA